MNGRLWKTVTTTHSGITLLSFTTKIFSHKILNRINTTVDNIWYQAETNWLQKRKIACQLTMHIHSAINFGTKHRMGHPAQSTLFNLLTLKRPSAASIPRKNFYENYCAYQSTMYTDFQCQVVCYFPVNTRVKVKLRCILTPLLFQLQLISWRRKRQRMEAEASNGHPR